MPSRPKRPCNHPRCPNLTKDRFCEAHSKQERQRADKQRGTAHERGYNSRWRRYSKWYLKQPENVFCKLQYKGCNNLAQCVDHIKPAYPDSEEFFDPDNHQSACIHCNSVKGRKEDRGIGKPFEANLRV